MTNIYRLPLRHREFSVENILKTAKATAKPQRRKVVQLEYRKKK